MQRKTIAVTKQQPLTKQSTFFDGARSFLSALIGGAAKPDFTKILEQYYQGAYENPAELFGRALIRNQLRQKGTLTPNANLDFSRLIVTKLPPGLCPNGNLDIRFCVNLGELPDSVFLMQATHIVHLSDDMSPDLIRYVLERRQMPGYAGPQFIVHKPQFQSESTVGESDTKLIDAIDDALLPIQGPQTLEDHLVLTYCNGAPANELADRASIRLNLRKENNLAPRSGLSFFRLRNVSELPEGLRPEGYLNLQLCVGLIRLPDSVFDMSPDATIYLTDDMHQGLIADARIRVNKPDYRGPAIVIESADTVLNRNHLRINLQPLFNFNNSDRLESAVTQVDSYVDPRNIDSTTSQML